ncbi:Alpha-1,3-mannosyltransferase CMT1 [Colletotrichum sp. SAR 10_70]|nr:Alpha-1,3-mannosyltransferase CMT1 [Colletotrichum siamense]KAI8155275.1 Alpha-1,3-mannosyltransferase CMT1 [Colletotrichum sp. SAR 10_70]KAI8161447.1 Alpha-1,3-mannosyltransferase CMT1 [Colletotrichum sp. SAR 10_71]KAI8174221.1 Alpha-1,3-mannosyltransferase CMT1 [Colletotrichum sp. SAR 10_75]KAI8223821.1 Alpha-1,3-mannosyltransferase CMT1 [Colletotrichum sp. SAR 10_86]
MLLPIRRLKRTSLLHICLLLLALDAYLIIRNRPVTDYPASIPSRHPGNETFFIASIHRNNGVLLAHPVSSNILKLVDYLGPDRVHFSAVESGSKDDTKARLSSLQEQLDAKGVSNTIILGKTAPEQLAEIHDRPPPSSGFGPPPPGWTWNPHENQFDMRRVTYLARERNRAMDPLAELLASQDRRFDKVIWLNDVVFETREVHMLLGTRGGAYAAACAMDFILWPYYYDTFALRDDAGLKTASWYWPWFHSPRARASAEAMEPVEVKSCWNGMVVFDAAPFYDERLRFRGVEDSLAAMHLEGSECCLIHADNPLGREKGVWLNPNVRVGYNEKVFEETKMDRFPTAWAAVVGFWANRYLRVRNGIQLTLERWAVEKKLRQWVDETPPSELPRSESGEMCLINEMQIMWENGWKHI